MRCNNVDDRSTPIGVAESRGFQGLVKNKVPSVAFPPCVDSWKCTSFKLWKKLFNPLPPSDAVREQEKIF